MSARRAVVISAGVAFCGTLASGPLGIWLVASTHPQPAWRDAATFAEAYHPIQSAPFACGFALVGGMVALIAGLHALAPATVRPRTTTAVALSGAFAGMIFVNYAVQTTFVPALVHEWSPEQAPLVAALNVLMLSLTIAAALAMRGTGLVSSGRGQLSTASHAAPEKNG